MNMIISLGLPGGTEGEAGDCQRRCSWMATSAMRGERLEDRTAEWGHAFARGVAARRPGSSPLSLARMPGREDYPAWRDETTTAES